MVAHTELAPHGQPGTEPELDPLTQRVLALRRDRAARSALRRANHARTRYYAVPLVGGFVKGTLSEADMRFVSLCASFDEIAQASEVSLGQALRRNDPSRGDPDGPVAKRLFAIQRQPLAVADSTVRSLLSIAEPHRLDWNRLLWTLRRWEQKDLSRRVAVRERLLRDFYVMTPAEDVATESKPKRSKIEHITESSPR